MSLVFKIQGEQAQITSLLVFFDDFLAHLDFFLLVWQLNLHIYRLFVYLFIHLFIYLSFCMLFLKFQVVA